MAVLRDCDWTVCNAVAAVYLVEVYAGDGLCKTHDFFVRVPTRLDGSSDPQ